MLTDISTRVSCLMAEKHLTVSDMRKLGIDTKTLKGILNKPEGTKLGTLLKIATAMNVDIDEILETPTSRGIIRDLRFDLFNTKMRLNTKKDEAIKFALLVLSILIYSLTIVYGFTVLQRIIENCTAQIS